MSSKRLFSTFLQSAVLVRIGYPLGVAVVFCIIFLSAFFSYRFFFVMIERVTELQSLEASSGVTFHLDAYRTIAKVFTALTPLPSALSDEKKRESVVAFRNAQLRNDRVILFEALLKDNGWTVSAVQEKGEELKEQPITTITMKEAHAKEADTLVALLEKNGFIVARGKPLSKEEKFDILITLGAY